VEAFEKHKSARKMDPVSRQILKALYEAREVRARETDKPLFRVVSDETLGEIAIRKPQSREELGRIPGCTPPLVSRHGDMLMKAVQAGTEAGPLLFVRKPFVAPDLAEEERYESLRAWRKGIAEARGVEVDVIVGNAALKIIAKEIPNTVEALGALNVLDASRLRRYGEAIVAIAVRPPSPNLKK
jgi:ribonuclease D